MGNPENPGDGGGGGRVPPLSRLQSLFAVFQCFSAGWPRIVLPHVTPALPHRFPLWFLSHSFSPLLFTHSFWGKRCFAFS